MISEHSDFKEYRSEQQQISETDKQRLDKINEINLAIKKEIKKVKKPYLLNSEYYVPNVKFYSANIPRKLYWTEISKVKALKLMFARMGIATTATVVSAINVRRVVIIATAILAVLLLLGLATLLVIRGLNDTSEQGGPTIEVDKTGDITLTVYTNETNVVTDGVVKVENYSLDSISYNIIEERVLVTNTSVAAHLFILMYAEISLEDEDSNLNSEELYVALNNVDSRFTFEPGHKGVMYTKESIEVGVAFNAFKGLGVCVYSGFDPNPWANKTIHIKINFRAYTSFEDLEAELDTLSSEVYCVDYKDINGETVSTTNPAIRSKLE